MRCPFDVRSLLYSVYRTILILASVIFTLASAQEDISLEGGDTTISDPSSMSYDHPLSNLSSSRDMQQHALGAEGFRRNFARSPIAGKIRIGPKFNNVSCIACHVRNGRGEPKFARQGSESVVKVAAPSGVPSVPGGPVPIRNIGVQLRDHAIVPARPDGKVVLTWEFSSGRYSDGTQYELRKPIILIKNVRLPAGGSLSLRRPPPVFGTGLHDAFSADTIRSFEDAGDLNGDGISGRANLVWNSVRNGTQIGKFGWKATSPSAALQIATAYAIDMGVTNPLIPLGKARPDIDRQIFDRTAFYTLTLAVPEARDREVPEVKHGKALFASLGCNSCHMMTIRTGKYAIRELSNQTIHPFTDLLLHDMGDGLADHRSEFEASGNEWRTASLWGIGLTGTVIGQGNENYLHDGRARSLEEAILWHGGEAEASRNVFLASDTNDRYALIQFLRSL